MLSLKSYIQSYMPQGRTQLCHGHATYSWFSCLGDPTSLLQLTTCYQTSPIAYAFSWVGFDTTSDSTQLCAEVRVIANKDNQAITFQHLQEVESVGNQLSEDFAAFVNVYNASKSNWALRYKHRKTNRRSATTSLYSIIEAVLDRVNDPYQWVHVKFDNEQDFCRAVDALAPKDSLFTGISVESLKRSVIDVYPTEARMMNTEKNISLSSVCLQVIF
nr:hypothetical protein L203_03688 [Cryptococcus depauperatus CBS 7841]